MATSRSFVLHLAVLGALLVTAQCRIVSFHAPSPVQPKFVDAPIFGAQHLFPVVASEPAPVREEQNEPPPPDSRTRNRQLVRDFLPNQFDNYGNPVPPRNPSVPQGVVQVLNNVIPNAPPRIVNPPPPEMVPDVRDIQPFSVDPRTGEPLKQVSPTFRQLISPTAAPVNVPNPINVDSFGRGFGGAPILDVTGEGEARAQNNAAFNSFGGFGSFDNSFNFAPSTPSPLRSSSSFGSFSQPEVSSGFRPPTPISGGFRPLGSLSGDGSSVSSSSQSLPGTTASFGSTIFH